MCQLLIVYVVCVGMNVCVCAGCVQLFQGLFHGSCILCLWLCYFCYSFWQGWELVLKLKDLSWNLRFFIKVFVYRNLINICMLIIKHARFFSFPGDTDTSVSGLCIPYRCSIPYTEPVPAELVHIKYNFNILDSSYQKSMLIYAAMLLPCVQFKFCPLSAVNDKA